MHYINFLPQTFLIDQARRQRIIRQLVLIGVVIGVIGCWFVVTRAQVNRRTEIIKAVAHDAEVVKQRVAESNKLQQQRAVLLHQVKIQRELAQPISHTDVIGMVSRLMTAQMSVTEVSMRTQRPKPATTGAATAKRPARGRGADAATTPAAEPDLIHIDLVGLSPSDIEIANFVGALAQHPLFENVKMQYSRVTNIGAFEAREFRIEMDVPLDRDYRDQKAASVSTVSGSLPGAGAEVAHAD